MNTQNNKQSTQNQGNTQAKGQTPKAKDSPDHDEHHDESRRNMFDPKVAEALKGGEKKQ